MRERDRSDRRVCLPLETAERLLVRLERIRERSREIAEGCSPESPSNVGYDIHWAARSACADLERHLERTRGKRRHGAYADAARDAAFRADMTDTTAASESTVADGLNDDGDEAGKGGIP